MRNSPAAYIQVSNLLTYLSLAAGLFAVNAGAKGSWSIAGGLIAVAAIADTFDGRFARRFTRTNDEHEFGAHIDSLSDAVTFGLVPMVTLYLLLPPGRTLERAAFGAAAFAYVLAAITRLGYYNLANEETLGFIGLPVPAAGLILSSSFLARPGTVAATLVALCSAVAMVSPIRVPRPRGVGLVAFVLWPAALIGLHLYAFSAP
jgi:CDP-diacylglycerol---serine O-phosphatidyltransferase